MLNRHLIVSAIVYISTSITFGTMVCAQQQLGMRMERRAGTYSLALNPALAMFQPVGWDVQLAQADLFGQQNYAFFRSSSIPHLWRNRENIVSVADIEPGTRPPAGAVVQDFYGSDRGLAYGVIQGRISGPGFTARIGEQHMVGVVAQMRVHASCYRLPNELRYQPSIEQIYGQRILNGSERIEAMAWGEVAGFYGFQTELAAGDLTIGVVPKYLMGLQGGFLRANAPFFYTRINQDTIDFESGDWDYALTTDLANQIDPQNPNAPTPAARINGRGFGLDIGAVWSVPMPDADDPRDYRWRVGVSLLDLGGIRFGQNAERHSLQFDTTITVPTDPLTATQSAQDLINQVSQDFLNDPAASLEARSFRIGLPTALSVQADVAITPHLYVGAVATQRIPLNRHSLRRANTLAVIPRFEHAWGSLSVPLQLNDTRTAHVGLAARLGWLTIGSDDLLGWTSRRDLRGGDLYIGLKINGFTLKWDRGHTRRSRRMPRWEWGGLRAKDRRWHEVGCFVD
jgi:Family of unknown function (DUF5723)